MISIKQLEQDFAGQWRQQVVLANSNWFGVGGPAEYYYKPANSIALAKLLADMHHYLPITIIGVGSNLLVRDGGIRGIIVRLGREFTKLELVEDGIVIAGAACLCSNLANFAATNQLAGLEFYIGIPGTVGGALAMNAGAYGNDTSQVLIQAEVINANGEIQLLTRQEIGYYYRGQHLPPGSIFTRGWFRSTNQSSTLINRTMLEIINKREATQPIRSKTSGSTFKNPSAELKAWQLIDQAGCRGLTIGGAQVSTKHCNFFINTGRASASELEELINTVQQRVFDRSGIKLELEIQILGEHLEHLI